MDNFFTGSHHNIAHHIGKPNFELLRHDVVEPILLEVRRVYAAALQCRGRLACAEIAAPQPALAPCRPGWRRAARPGRSGNDPARAWQVDQIYHLACPASPVHYKYNPVKTIKARAPRVSRWLPQLPPDVGPQTNVMGTLNMLGLAKRVKARFLLTSTSEVYGDPLQHPQTEEYWGNVNPIGERSCYDEGKRVAETLTFDYHREHGVDIRVARIFNTYGPRMALDDGRVVSNFVSQALRGEPLTVYGDGGQTRSFQYVSDLVGGLVALMEGEHTGPFNIGNPNEFTMLELAQHVKEVINPAAEIAFRENTADDPSRRKPDISKAMELLHWQPTVELREGLTLMVNDFRARILGETTGTPSSHTYGATLKRACEPPATEATVAGKKLKLLPTRMGEQGFAHTGN